MIDWYNINLNSAFERDQCLIDPFTFEQLLCVMHRSNVRMIEPFFQSAQCRAFGNRVNWHEYQGNIRVQTYTVKGMQ